jgi:hypothetical protein
MKSSITIFGDLLKPAEVYHAFLSHSLNINYQACGVLEGKLGYSLQEDTCTFF